MTITFVQRSLIIFAVFLCYYHATVDAGHCEDHPYDPDCRGSQEFRGRKRLVPMPIMRAVNCDEGDCRIPRMKYLIAILDDNSYGSNDVHLSNSKANSRKNRLRLGDAKDVYLDDY